MNLSVCNHLILLGLRSFRLSDLSDLIISFHKSMALVVTVHFPKLLVLKDFLRRRPFIEGVVL